MTYGQIIALAGDFYADPTRPISNQTSLANQQNQVKANFTSLVAVAASKAEAQSILNTMNQELIAANSAELRGLDPSTAYVINGKTWDLQYNGITGGSYTSVYTPGKYEKIPATNWDHFGVDAWTSYSAAHGLAIAMAIAGKTDADLDQAYAVNAFADHYLTDLFSSGHLRTTRRQLYERQYGATGPLVDPRTSAWTPDSATSGMLAKCQHDEDSLNGLWVTNLAGDQWLCFGDSRYRDPQNYANAALVQKAVANSINEVFQAFTNKRAPTSYAAQQLIPIINRDWNSRDNYSPLFLMSSGQLLNRNDESDLLNYNHSDFYLYTAYHQSPDTPIKGSSLFATKTISGPNLPAQPSVDPLGASGGPGMAPSPISLVVSSSSRVDVVVYRAGSLAWRKCDQNGWADWSVIGFGVPFLGSSFTSAPTLCANGPGNLSVFALGAGGKLLENHSNQDSWKHSMLSTQWDTLAGTWVSAPTVSAPQANSMAVYALGRANELDQMTWDGSKWHGPTNLSGVLLATPAVLARSADKDLFCLGTNNQVWYRTSNASSAWGQLHAPQGVALNSMIAVASWSAARMDWMARNVNGQISHNWYNSPNWDTQGEIIAVQTASAPVLATTAVNSLDLFYVASDGTLRNRLYNNGHWQAEIVLSAGQPQVARTPVTAAFGGRLDVVYLGVDGIMYHNSRASTSGTWGTWQNIGTFETAGPPGYMLCAAKEGDSQTFKDPVDVAYGAAGTYNYQYRVTGKITFNNSTFGDPLPGTKKSGYYRTSVTPPATLQPTGYTQCATENQTVTFTVPTDVAYGANGNYTYRSRLTGAVTFNNATFGDPAPNIGKAGYSRPS